MFDMTDYRTNDLLHMADAGKLWNSECRLAMKVDYSENDVIYRCESPCRSHTADTEKVKAGLLWHFRGSQVSTYGIPDDQILDPMLTALHLAWVRDGKILTAQFD